MPDQAPRIEPSSKGRLWYDKQRGVVVGENFARNDLNQELVEHCAKAAQKDFGTYGMTGMKPDILWQAVAATVIHEAVLFLKAGNPLNELLAARDGK